MEGKPVCDDGWENTPGKRGANVVCRYIQHACIVYPSLRMLGYRSGIPTKDSHFGTVAANFGMDDVSCNGRETDIRDCRHSKTHDCAGREAAGVICS